MPLTLCTSGLLEGTRVGCGVVGCVFLREFAQPGMFDLQYFAELHSLVQCLSVPERVGASCPDSEGRSHVASVDMAVGSGQDEKDKDDFTGPGLAEGLLQRSESAGFEGSPGVADTAASFK